MPATPRPSFQLAAAFAARAHEHQKRKDKETPYFSHPVRVALTLRHVFNCADDAALCAALLHDTIEDTKTDYDDIQQNFGEEVADIVAALTKNMLLPEPKREPEYDARLSKADWRARLIKVADVYDNLSETDAVKHSGKAKLKDKATRAVALVKHERKSNPTLDTAAKALEALIKQRLR